MHWNVISCVEIFGILSLYYTSLYRKISYVPFISKGSCYICLSPKLKLGFFFFGISSWVGKNFWNIIHALKCNFMHWNLWNLIFTVYEFMQEDLLRTVRFQRKLLYLSFSEAETKVFFLRDIFVSYKEFLKYNLVTWSKLGYKGSD